MRGEKHILDFEVRADLENDLQNLLFIEKDSSEFRTFLINYFEDGRLLETFVRLDRLYKSWISLIRDCLAGRIFYEDYFDRLRELKKSELNFRRVN